MLDLKFVKEHLAEVKENIKNRNMVADADLVVKLYDERTALTTKLQALQQKRNENAANMKQKPVVFWRDFPNKVEESFP